MSLAGKYPPSRKKLCQIMLFLLIGVVGTIIILKIENAHTNVLLSDAMSISVRKNTSSEGSTIMRDRRHFVKGMMKFAWDNYVQYAWEHNELHPVFKTGAGGAGIGEAKLGATIIDSLDTLKLMGLNAELHKATEWVELSFNIKTAVTTMSVFEANIRLLGGLLSAHALTTNKVFLEKAIQVGDVLMAAFNGSPSGFPYSLIELPSLHGSLYSWIPGECVSLADVGTLDMEFFYLSEITGDQKYLEKVKGIRRLIKNARNEEGLYPNMLSYRDSKGVRCARGAATTIGAFGDSFYEYLFKSWLLSAKTDIEAKELFDNALKVLQKKLLQTSSSGFKYFAKLNEGGNLVHNVEHLACFIGGLYALSAEYSPDAAERMELAKETTKTCHASYDLTRTKVGPEAFVFDEHGNPKPAFDANHYSLRPEVAESYYYLWKISGNEMYRDWAWEAAKAIERHCKKAHGYTGITDVDNLRPNSDNIQQTFFMAETLKYLYLTFVEDDPLPLDSWVFNTEAHPLPVIGSKPYRQAFFAWRGQAFSSDSIIPRD